MNLCVSKVKKFKPSMMSQIFQWSSPRQQFDDPSKRCDLCLSLCIVGNRISAAVARWVTSALHPAWLPNITTMINYDTDLEPLEWTAHCAKRGGFPSGYKKRLMFLIV